MKNFFKNIIFIVYIIIAIFTTICLLSFNNYRVSEFGSNSLLIIDDNELEPEFHKGDLVIVNKDDTIIDGEKIFFYDAEDRTIAVKLGKVISSERVTKTESTFTLEGGHKISSEYVLGTSKTVSVIPKVGTYLGILESKWGFLFLIVLPALIAFLYQITVVFSEIREAKD